MRKWRSPRWKTYGRWFNRKILTCRSRQISKTNLTSASMSLIIRCILPFFSGQSDTDRRTYDGWRIYLKQYSMIAWLFGMFAVPMLSVTFLIKNRAFEKRQSDEGSNLESDNSKRQKLSGLATVSESWFWRRVQIRQRFLIRQASFTKRVGKVSDGSRY